MGFLDDFSFDFDYDPYTDNGDYSSGVGGGGDFSIPTPPQARTRANNYGTPGRDDFLSLYQRLGGGRGNEVEDYYNTKSPEWTRYQELARSRPESESIIGDYLNQMPTHEQYAPGWGRKAAGFLLGTLSGGGGKASREFIDRPYLNAFQDWKAQGTQISNRARLSDAARGRELTSLKTNLDQLAREKRYGAQSREAGDRTTLALTKGAEGAEGDAAKLAERAETDKARRDAQEQGLRIAKSRLELAETAARWAKDPNNPKFKGKNTPLGVNDPRYSNLRQIAGETGIDFNHLDAPEKIAGDIVRKQLYNNSMFSDMFDRDPDGNFIPNKKATPDRIQLMQRMIQLYTDQLLGKMGANR